MYELHAGSATQRVPDFILPDAELPKDTQEGTDVEQDDKVLSASRNYVAKKEIHLGRPPACTNGT